MERKFLQEINIVVLFVKLNLNIRSIHHMAGINNIARIKKYGDIKEIKRA